MRTNDFDYDLPPQLIAQTPGPRGESRLLVLHRESGLIEHRRFSDLPQYLMPSDLLVLNDTRVSARRLRALRDNGQEAEVLLLRPAGERSWHALVRPGRAFRPGRSVTLVGDNGERVQAEITGFTDEGGRVLQLPASGVRDNLDQWGAIPLRPIFTFLCRLRRRIDTKRCMLPMAVQPPRPRQGCISLRNCSVN